MNPVAPPLSPIGLRSETIASPLDDIASHLDLIASPLDRIALLLHPIAPPVDPIAAPLVAPAILRFVLLLTLDAERAQPHTYMPILVARACGGSARPLNIPRAVLKRSEHNNFSGLENL